MKKEKKKERKKELKKEQEQEEQEQEQATGIKQKWEGKAKEPDSLAPPFQLIGYCEAHAISFRNVSLSHVIVI